MHHQRVAVGEFGDQILSAAPQRADRLSAEPPRETGGEGLAKILAIEERMRETRADHRRGERPAYPLNFRKFRHQPMISLYPESDERPKFTDRVLDGIRQHLPEMRLADARLQMQQPVRTRAVGTRQDRREAAC